MVMICLMDVDQHCSGVNLGGGYYLGGDGVGGEDG